MTDSSAARRGARSLSAFFRALSAIVAHVAAVRRIIRAMDKCLCMVALTVDLAHTLGVVLDIASICFSFFLYPHACADGRCGTCFRFLSIILGPIERRKLGFDV